MKIKINSKEFELNFGVRFVNELDHVAALKTFNGVEFGMGLTKSIPALKAYDPAVLAKVLYSSTVLCSPRPGLEDIYDFIDSPATDIEKLFDDVNAELIKSNALKVALKKATA
jgi:hypothetical protein